MQRDSRIEARLDWLIGREVAGAFLAVLLLVSMMAFLPVRFLQIPGYLVLSRYMWIRNSMVLGLSGSAYTVSVAIYLYVVAMLFGNLYRWDR